MYARKRDRELQQAKLTKKGNADPVKYTLMKLREIDDCEWTTTLFLELFILFVGSWYLGCIVYMLHVIWLYTCIC